MLRPIIRTVIVLFLLTLILPTVSFSNFVTLVIAAIILTLLYGLIRPILKLLFLPINIVTLGLFSAILNVFLLWLATYLVPGFRIESMILFGIELNYIWSLIVVSILIGFLHPLVKLLI